MKKRNDDKKLQKTAAWEYYTFINPKKIIFPHNSLAISYRKTIHTFIINIKFYK